MIYYNKDDTAHTYNKQVSGSTNLWLRSNFCFVRTSNTLKPLGEMLNITVNIILLRTLQ